MPLSLFALCGVPGNPIVKRVVTTAAVQNELDALFTTLEGLFNVGVDEQIEFDGRWKPDANELLYVAITPEAIAIRAALQADALAIDEISNSFDDEEIRALAVRRGNRILVQAFSNQQRLSRKFALTLRAGIFNKLVPTTFAIDNQIHIIIDGDRIKFKSFNMAKRVIDLSTLYSEATDRDIQELCNLPRVSANAQAIIAVANPYLRKLISSVKKSDVFTNHTANALRQKAGSVNLDVEVHNDKLILPTTRAELRALFSFLDSGVYISPVDSLRYITNSRRAMP